jgi:hypothetical protein
MGKADTLSRRENHMAGIENNNKQMTFISENRILSLEEISLFDKIKEKHSGCTSPNGSILCEGLYFYNNKLWVPSEFCWEVSTQFHDHPIFGYKGAEKTQELLVQYYSWPGVKKDVQDYCRSCERCA